MNTDKYTTYKCNTCERPVPVGEVRILGHLSFCVTCLVDRYHPIKCKNCGSSRNVYRYERATSNIPYICTHCLGAAFSVRRQLARGDLSRINGKRLGTADDGPPIPTSDKVSEKWKEITGCEVSS